MAVADAARTFWEQSLEAVGKSSSVSAKERAEAVFEAAEIFWEQATTAVFTAQHALDEARDRLIAYNDKRATEIGERVNKQFDAMKKRKKKRDTLDDVLQQVRRGKNTGPNSK